MLEQGGGRPGAYTQDDFAHSPFVAFYEVTRACDLVCRHCRACAQPQAHPHELTPEQSRRLIDQFASFEKPPVLVFTGGDPMKRSDIYDLVSYASSKLAVAMTPSATPLLTKDAIRRLKDAGLSRLALSLDSPDADIHDAFRGVDGSYERTLQALADAREVGMPIQVNTTVTRHNVGRLEEMAAMLDTTGIVLWSVFFLIPVGRGLHEQRIQPEEYEQTFELLWQEARRRSFAIKTTEAPQYRRFVLQRMGNPQHQPQGAMPGRIQRAPIGVNDGKGVMFVSHTGSVYPSGFLPIRCGKFPEESICDVYRDAPLFRDLRNPDALQGKCGACEFRPVCGGSRARSYAIARDPLAAEPDCPYIPRVWKEGTPCLA